MTGDMEDMVVPDVMNGVFLAQGRYPENFVLFELRKLISPGLIFISIKNHPTRPDPTTADRPTDRDKLLQSYISAKNKDNEMKVSGYDPWGLPRSSMLSRMTLSSKSSIRNPQRPPSTPLLDPPFLTHF